MISDPRALQYIFQQAGYRYPKTEEETKFQTDLFGDGIVAARGISAIALQI
jgi:hypothetical protein